MLNNASGIIKKTLINSFSGSAVELFTGEAQEKDKAEVYLGIHETLFFRSSEASGQLYSASLKVYGLSKDDWITLLTGMAFTTQ